MRNLKLDIREWMEGYIAPGAPSYAEGYVKGARQRLFFRHDFLLRVNSIHDFVNRPDHSAALEGSLRCDLFGGLCRVKEGTFQMFVDDQALPGLKYMLYHLYFDTPRGEVFTMDGFKLVHNNRTLDLWSDTTTLFTRFFRGMVPPDQMETLVPQARGVLYIPKLDLIKSFLSFRVPGGRWWESYKNVLAFYGFFIRNLWQVYAAGNPSRPGPHPRHSG